MFSPVENPVDRRRGKWIEVVSVKVGVPLTVMVVGVEPVVVPIHYYERSYLCMTEEECAMCQAGVGRQHMMFIAVIHAREQKMVRMAYREGMVDVCELGAKLEISLSRRGMRYSIKRFLVKEEPLIKVPVDSILARVMVLHRLRPRYVSGMTAGALWSSMRGEISPASHVGAVAWGGRTKKTAS